MCDVCTYMQFEHFRDVTSLLNDSICEWLIVLFTHIIEYVYDCVVL